MSEISDMYKQILSLQEKLLKTKIQEGIKATKEKRELSRQEGIDLAFFPDDIELLKKILDYKVNDLDYDESTYVSFYEGSHFPTHIFKINGEYISIHQHQSVKLTDVESIRKRLDELGYSEEKKLEIEELLNRLVDIDLEELKRTPKPEITVEEDEHQYGEEGDYEYDEEYEEYYARTEPHDWDVIWNILRNKIVDYKANAMFGENCNFCEIGTYSDMPGGEEQIATTLNSMSRETLKEYFKEYPEDIELFEQMRSKYPNIQSLDEREAEEHSAGDEFVENIVDYATKKVEVRDQNAKAEQLAQDYEQQLPENQQSLDD